MAIDLGQYGIRVNAICPGYTQTPAVDGWFEAQKDPVALRKEIDARHPVERMGQPSNVGALAAYLADDERSGFMTGNVIPLDGGITLGC